MTLARTGFVPLLPHKVIMLFSVRPLRSSMVQNALAVIAFIPFIPANLSLPFLAMH